MFCTPNNSLALWNKYKKYLGEDFIHNCDPDWEQSTLHAIQMLLNSHDLTLKDFGLPLLRKQRKYNVMQFDKVISIEDQKKLSNDSWEMQNKLNMEQCIAFATINDAFIHGNGGVFFLDGAAGTGKTYLYNRLLTKVRSRGHSVIAVASSGVAALLTGGITAHSRFKIPIEEPGSKTCNITKESALAASLRKASLIVWDEAPMLHRDCFDIVVRCLQDITETKEPFGGILTVLGGDLRQTLPVIPKGSKDDILDSILFKSNVCSGITILKLIQNMRASNASPQFGKWLLDVGEDKLPQYELLIMI